MKKLLFAVAAVAAAAFTSSANAAVKVIDFSAEALTNGERGIADGSTLNTAQMGGLNLEFRAGIGGAGRDFAYFNAGAPGSKAVGLGTCTRLDSAAQCTPSYDDNIAQNEWVQVGFLDGPFNVARLSFNGDGPTSLDGSNGLIKITTSLNSVISVFTMTFAQATTYGFGLVDWIRFGFGDTEFVVASISDIPVPGALPLLLSGLAGLGFAARRRKA